AAGHQRAGAYLNPARPVRVNLEPELPGPLPPRPAGRGPLLPDPGPVLGVDGADPPLFRFGRGNEAAQGLAARVGVGAAACGVREEDAHRRAGAEGAEPLLAGAQLLLGAAARGDALVGDGPA